MRASDTGAGRNTVTNCRRAVPGFHVTDSVYENIKVQARGAVLSLIEKERDGELIDRTLLKNILGIFIEVGTGYMGQIRVMGCLGVITYKGAFMTMDRNQSLDLPLP